MWAVTADVIHKCTGASCPEDTVFFEDLTAFSPLPAPLF